MCFFVSVWFNGFVVVVVACAFFYLLACLLCCDLFHGGGYNRDEGVCWEQEGSTLGPGEEQNCGV